MSGMEKSVSELHMMLKAVEASMKRAPATVLIAQKDLGKGKGKGKRKADVMMVRPSQWPSPIHNLPRRQSPQRMQFAFSVKSQDTGREIANCIWKI